jgi:hypothetical protein
MEKQEKSKLGYTIAIIGFVFLGVVVLDALSGAPQIPLLISGAGLSLTFIGLYFAMANR